VTFGDAVGNGSSQAELTYHYRVSNGATGTLPRNSGVIGGLENGTQYTVTMWATSNVAGVEPGGETQSNATVPFGKPIITPTAVERQDGAVRFVWTVNDNGSPLTAGGSGEHTNNGLKPEESTSYVVTATNAAGSSSITMEGKALPSKTKVTIERFGNAVGARNEQGATCNHPSCAYIRVSISDSGFQSDYTVTYNATGPAGNAWAVDPITSNGVAQGRVYGYPNTQVWVTITGPDGTFKSNEITWPNN
jgi:hypothetical protein